MDNTVNDRQQKLRERRKAEGWKRKEYWLKPDTYGLDEVRDELKRISEQLPENPEYPATAYAVARAEILELLVRIDCE